MDKWNPKMIETWYLRLSAAMDIIS